MSEILAKARQIESWLRNRFEVRAFLTGSTALGLNLPGSRDFDFVLPAEPDGWQHLEDRLACDFTPSAFNSDKSSFLVFQGEILNESVDIAMVPTTEAEPIRRAIERIQGVLDDERRRGIVSRKSALLGSWFFPRRRYRIYKKQVERELGFPRLERRKWFRRRAGC